MLFFVACSDSGNPATSAGQSAAAETVVSHSEMAGDATRTVARLTIEGMSCAAGCGGKIQQDLRAMNGVANTDLDFAEERPENVVSVEFDPSKLNEQQLIHCVHNIADGQYHVKSVEVVSYKSSESTSGGSGGGAEMKTDQLGKAFQVLNLLQTISGMIRE